MDDKKKKVIGVSIIAGLLCIGVVTGVSVASAVSPNVKETMTLTEKEYKSNGTFSVEDLKWSEDVSKYNPRFADGLANITYKADGEYAETVVLDIGGTNKKYDILVKVEGAVEPTTTVTTTVVPTTTAKPTVTTTAVPTTTAKPTEKTTEKATVKSTAKKTTAKKVASTTKKKVVSTAKKVEPYIGYIDHENKIYYIGSDETNEDFRKNYADKGYIPICLSDTWWEEIDRQHPNHPDNRDPATSSW